MSTIKKPAVALLVILSSLLLFGYVQDYMTSKQLDQAAQVQPPRHRVLTQSHDSTFQDASYSPIAPAKNSKPVKKNISDSERDTMPPLESEAFSGSKKGIRRSVPFEQTLMAKKQDDSNGPLKSDRIVAFYGDPLSSLMGILGQGSSEEMIKRLKEQTRAYSTADPSHPAVPALELIASVAQRNPGPNGLYVSWTPTDVIKRYIKMAQDNKALVILDIQLGHDSVMNEVKELQPFLTLPNVELAIDTEFHVKAGQVPGEELGHVAGSDIQQAIQYVNGLVQTHHLPDKIVMVHEFQEGIVTNKQLIKPTAHVEVVLNADGFGTPFGKISKYLHLVRNEPIQYGGFKLFYSQDQPLLTPQEVVALDPAPAIVEYQ